MSTYRKYLRDESSSSCLLIHEYTWGHNWCSGPLLSDSCAEKSERKKITVWRSSGSPSIVANGHFVSRECKLLFPQRAGGLSHPFSMALNSTGPPTLVLLKHSDWCRGAQRNRIQFHAEKYSLQLLQCISCIQRRFYRSVYVKLLQIISRCSFHLIQLCVGPVDCRPHTIHLCCKLASFRAHGSRLCLHPVEGSLKGGNEPQPKLQT